jgi:thioredoxin 1
MRGGPPAQILAAAHARAGEGAATRGPAVRVRPASRCGIFQAVQKESTMTIKHVSDASFEQDVLKSESPVLVDYWAEWCGPCKMIAPILDEVSRDYEGRLQVAKLNVDENQAVPAKFGIRGIPTLMLFKNGAQVATKVGALSKSQLTLFLDSHL